MGYELSPITVDIKPNNIMAYIMVHMGSMKSHSCVDFSIFRPRRYNKK